MAGTVTGTIGNNAGVFFTYNGTGAAQHLDVGFVPSMVEFHNYTGTSIGTLSWTWNFRSGYAAVATIHGWQPGAAGVGQAIGTVQDVASIQGIQVGTDTTINAAVNYIGLCWR